jgi:flagellin
MPAQALRQLSVSPARNTASMERLTTGPRPTAETGPSSAPVKTSSINPLDILPREATGRPSADLGVGLGEAVDADLARESARLQSLQSRVQSDTQALSTANKAPQSLLSLFR